MDFDDLIMTTVNILQAFPDVAAHYRRRFRHVLVDEYQDTNHAQYVLVRELVGGSLSEAIKRAEREETAAASRPDWRRRPVRRSPVPAAELTVVGDADQSIYAFRGATIRNIAEFETRLPGRRGRSCWSRTTAPPRRSSARPTPSSSATPTASRRRLWTDAGAGAQIDRLRRRQRARRGVVRRRGDRPAHRRRGRPARRRRGVLPDQRPVPGAGGGVRPGRPALQGGRRHPVLRAPRGQGRAGLPAGAGQPARHGEPAPDPQRAQAGDRGPGRGVRGALAERERISLRRRAAPGRARRRGSPPAR